MLPITDFHSHILPEIDDGSSCVEESLAMLRMVAEQGIRRVVATPHFYARYDSVDGFLQKRKYAEEKLRTSMTVGQEFPEICVGAEVYYFRGISESEMLPELAICGTNHVLIEFPPAPWQDTIYRELVQIREKRDLIPVVAHIDRYIRRFRTYGIPDRLADLPVLVQANASFFLEPATAGMALRLLKKDRIHLLGSDAHNLRSRKPNLGDALKHIEKKLGSAGLNRIAEYEMTVFDIQE